MSYSQACSGLTKPSRWKAGHIPDGASTVYVHGTDLPTCLACFDGVSLIQDNDFGCQRLQLILQLGYKVVAGNEELKLLAFQLTVLALQWNHNRCVDLLQS